jgi:hypothetical protein
MRKLVLCILFLVGVSLGQIQQSPPAAVQFDDHAGFTQIFDGASLTNWDGAKDVWRVEDGAIVAESRPEKPVGTTFLIWRGGEPGDFEFKARNQTGRKWEQRYPVP